MTNYKTENCRKKYYKFPWTEDKVDYLIKWWPHFGTRGLALELKLSESQVKAKADKLKLKLLDRNNRLCILCRENFQSKRQYGFKCHGCWLLHRQEIRKKTLITFEDWVEKMVVTIKYRSKYRKIKFNLTAKYMINLWKKQNGLCYYSNIELSFPTHECMNSKHSLQVSAASIDRKNSSIGYLKNNVVWSSWICNAGKNIYSIEEYVQICKKVALNQNLM